METKELKKNKGITLIALVITIVVLLILAGVTIATLTGENGILTKATEAGKQTEIEGIREEAELVKQEVLSGDLVTGEDTAREDVINAIVDEMGGTANGNLITTEDGKYEIMVKEDNTIEVVEKGQGYIDAEYKEAAPESDFRWTTLEDGTVRIYEYLGTETSLHIPDTIDGKPVTVLKLDKNNGTSEGSFEGGKIATNVTLKSVKIPDTVKEIGYKSFSSEELEYIELPLELTIIGREAFSRNKLKEIEMPDTVTSIDERAFQENEIENLKLSSNITRIERFTFYNNEIKSIEIPEGVTFVGDKAFGNNQATKIEIPSTVTTMEGGAFTKNNLEEIIYGRTAAGEEDKTIINSYAGRNAGDVVIPEGVKEIENSAFSDVGLTSLEIPASVKDIGGGAFNGDNLEKLIIYAQPEKVRTFSFHFEKIEYLEFKANTFCNSMGAIYAQSITEMKVPYSEDHSVLEYYKGLIENSVIVGEVESITEK